MTPKFPGFPTNVSISNNRVHMVCPGASTRKIVGRRRIVRKKISGVGIRGRRTTILMVAVSRKKKNKKKW